MSNKAEVTHLVLPSMDDFYDVGIRFSWPLIRFIVGVSLIPHGGAKLFGWFGGNINVTAGHFSQLGLEPALPLTYLVACTEFFGGILLIIGFLTRPAAAMIIGFLTVAMFLDEAYIRLSSDLPLPHYEDPVTWLVLAFFIFFRGGGPISVDAWLGKEF